MYHFCELRSNVLCGVLLVTENLDSLLKIEKQLLMPRFDARECLMERLDRKGNFGELVVGHV